MNSRIRLVVVLTCAVAATAISQTAPPPKAPAPPPPKPPASTLAPDNDRLPAERRYMPREVQEPQLSVNTAVTRDKDGSYIYKSRHFEFRSPGALGRTALTDVTKVFESTYELVARLPWGIRPWPEDGAPLFHARFFASRADYLRAGSPEWSAGLYSRKDKMFRTTLDELGLSLVGAEWVVKGPMNKETVSHEITHQMMHEYLQFMPVWMAEGLAEYVANLPYSSGKFSVASALEGIRRKHSKDGKAEEEARRAGSRYREATRPVWIGVEELWKYTTSIVRENPITSIAYVPPKKEQTTGGGGGFIQSVRPEVPDSSLPQKLANRYYSSYVLAFYFMHMDGNGSAMRFKKFFDSIHEERKKWAAFWKAQDEFEEKAKTLYAKYEEEYEAFKKLPGVKAMPDGSVLYPRHLQPPKAPDLRYPEPPDGNDPEKVCVKYLAMLLDGRSLAQLDADVLAAFAKAGVTLPK